MGDMDTVKCWLKGKENRSSELAANQGYRAIEFSAEDFVWELLDDCEIDPYPGGGNYAVIVEDAAGQRFEVSVQVKIETDVTASRRKGAG